MEVLLSSICHCPQDHMTNASFWLKTANSLKQRPPHTHTHTDSPSTPPTTSQPLKFLTSLLLSASLRSDLVPPAYLKLPWYSTVALGFATMKHTLTHTGSLCRCCYSNLAACSPSTSSLCGCGTNVCLHQGEIESLFSSHCPSWVTYSSCNAGFLQVLAL